MRFYTQQHRFYCGIDLHARTMHVCVLDDTGTVVFDKNLPCNPDAFRRAVASFRDGLVVGVECLCFRYWLADLSAKEKIAFVLGHALYSKAIHGGLSLARRAQGRRGPRKKFAPDGICLLRFPSMSTLPGPSMRTVAPQTPGPAGGLGRWPRPRFGDSPLTL
jgi:hypothetical protein